MARTVLFLVHGMGDHPEGWSAATRKLLEDSYVALADSSLASQAFDKRFEIVEITFDAELRALLAKWQEQGAAIGAIDAAVTPDALALVAQALLSAGTQHFFWTHAADVLLYAGMRTVREQLKVTVARQITTKLAAVEKAEGTLPTWAVIAHSLGTIVVHDALHALWTAPGSGFNPKRTRAQLVMMIANVSKLLQGATPVLASTVMPGPAGSTVPDTDHSPPWLRGCVHYLSVCHALDPFTVPGRFKPVLWPDLDAVEKKLYDWVEIDELKALNVHGLDHYLAHPEVHISMFRKLVGKRAVSAAQEKAALERYRATNPFSPADTVRIVQRLRGMMPGENTAWPIVRELWGRYRSHLESGLDDVV
jgi:hypothetical protein